MQEKQKILFSKLLMKFSELNILKDIVLVGSWCLPIYADLLKNHDEITQLKTQDIDIMLKNPPRINKPISLPNVLKELDFIYTEHPLTTAGKFLNDDLDLDILINKKGAGIEQYVKIQNLGINAISLRYLSLLEDNIIHYVFDGLNVNIPDPSAFVLHKFIISQERTGKDSRKREKDLISAVSLGEVLLTYIDQKTKMKYIFLSIHKNWRDKKILPVVKEHSEKIYEYLIECMGKQL